MSGSILTRADNVADESLRISGQISSETARHAQVKAKVTSGHRSTHSLLPLISDLFEEKELYLLNAKSYSFRVNHLSRVVTQYGSVVACFSSAADKLYNDVCRYNEESKGISHLSDSLYRYVGYAATSHLESDVSSHAMWVISSSYLDGAGDTSGQRTGIVPVDGVEIAIPVRPANLTEDPYTNSKPSAGTINDSITVPVEIATKLMIAYSNLGDVYIQYPISSDLNSNIIGVTRFEDAASVAEWCLTSGLDSEGTNTVRMGFYKNSLNGDSGPYYLVFKIGPSASESGSTCDIVLKSGVASGSWVWESSPFEVSSGSESMYSSDANTVRIGWGEADTYQKVVLAAIRLPIPDPATADIPEQAPNADGIVPFWGNVVEVAVTPHKNIEHWKVYTLDDVE